MALFALGNSLAGVSDGKLHHHLGISGVGRVTFSEVCRQLDAARSGVIDRIGDEVAEDAFEILGGPD
jgi:ABC-type nitrate/sulfonate/bicarbonate transport system ATPase subunit